MALQLLYVDDEEDLRTLVQCQLALEGYAVETAPDGPSALAMLARRPFDLVLVDLHMPGMDGAEVVRQMHARDLHPAVLLLTGDSSGDAAAVSGVLGAAGCVTKPFHFRELVSAIGRALPETAAGTAS